MCSEALLKQVRSLQVSRFSYHKILLNSFLIVGFLEDFGFHLSFSFKVQDNVNDFFLLIIFLFST